MGSTSQDSADACAPVALNSTSADNGPRGPRSRRTSPQRKPAEEAPEELKRRAASWVAEARASRPLDVPFEVEETVSARSGPTWSSVAIDSNGPRGPYVFEPMSWGVDWITATASKGYAMLEFEHIADAWFADARSGGRDVAAANRLGYKGYSEGGLFLGRSDQGSMLIMSGPCADPLAQEVMRVATNVSRVDVQATFWTGGEQPHMGRDGFERLQHMRPKNGRPPKLTYTEGWPDGETLAINKRVSDVYLRVYDKASEAGLGLPRSVWRYEVEFKRRVAKRMGQELALAVDHRGLAYALVQSWTTNKGLQWPGPPTTNDHSGQQVIVDTRADDLMWIRENFAKCVARKVQSHGLLAVIDALGLSSVVQIRSDYHAPNLTAHRMGHAGASRGAMDHVVHAATNILKEKQDAT